MFTKREEILYYSKGYAQLVMDTLQTTISENPKCSMPPQYKYEELRTFELNAEIQFVCKQNN